VILSFGTAALRDSCVALERAEQAFGVAIAADLIRFLAEVEAADTARELMSLYEAEHTTNGDSLRVRFTSRCEAWLDAVRVPVRGGSGTSDIWTTVRRVKLMNVRSIEDA
jgi:hypothetical protein